MRERDGCLGHGTAFFMASSFHHIKKKQTHTDLSSRPHPLPLSPSSSEPPKRWVQISGGVRSALPATDFLKEGSRSPVAVAALRST